MSCKIRFNESVHSDSLCSILSLFCGEILTLLTVNAAVHVLLVEFRSLFIKYPRRWKLGRQCLCSRSFSPLNTFLRVESRARHTVLSGFCWHHELWCETRASRQVMWLLSVFIETQQTLHPRSSAMIHTELYEETADDSRLFSAKTAQDFCLVFQYKYNLMHLLNMQSYRVLFAEKNIKIKWVYA